uniref:Signal-induced proliferation-associated 1-like protein C-terminal domain-containing protein n=1 Tax=Branchiostoma floridae TaxID=7739 RepID=C3Y0D9_BRAFL|eukprot:XP_002610202.1 hypothetical protein BRAFLDRAFT_77024 [Branchiostoma floridae]
MTSHTKRESPHGDSRENLGVDLLDTTSARLRAQQAAEYYHKSVLQNGSSPHSTPPAREIPREDSPKVNGNGSAGSSPGNTSTRHAVKIHLNLSRTSPPKANMNNNTTEDLSIQELDLGDGKSNNLVLSCPFFRNELGGEEERRISLSRGNGGSRASRAFREGMGPNLDSMSGLRPTTASVSVLDTGPDQDDMWPVGGRTRGYAIEHVDHGAYYFRRYFHGQSEVQNYLGVDENLGPIAISIRREKLPDHSGTGSSSNKDGGSPVPAQYMYRLIIRTSDDPSNSTSNLSEVSSHSQSSDGSLGSGQGHRDRLNLGTRDGNPSPNKSQGSPTQRRKKAGQKKYALDDSGSSASSSSPKASLRSLVLDDSAGTRSRPGSIATRGSSRSAALLQAASMQEDLLKLINPDVSEAEIQASNSRDGASGPGRPPIPRTVSDESMNGSRLNMNRSSSHDSLDRAGRGESTFNSIGPSPVANRPAPETETRPSGEASEDRSGGTNSENKLQPSARMSAGQQLRRDPEESQRGRRPQSALQRSTELETRVRQLQEELRKERQEKAALQAENEQLRQDNVRLQEESQTAAAQLRKFTEWFFNTIDRQ